MGKKLRNKLISYSLFIWVSILISSCANVYRLEGGSYIIERNGFLKRYIPGGVIYDYDYETMDKYDYDTSIYIKSNQSDFESEKVKVDVEKKTGEIIYQYQDGGNLKLPVRLKSSVTSFHFLPGIMGGVINDGQNLCELRKFTNHRKVEFIYKYVKDSTLLVHNELRNCVVNQIIIVEDEQFFFKYPLKLFVDKHSGVPLRVEVPYCTQKDAITGYISKECIGKKNFLLLKKKYLW